MTQSEALSPKEGAGYKLALSADRYPSARRSKVEGFGERRTKTGGTWSHT